jgi:hypothetical protein
MRLVRKTAMLAALLCAGACVDHVPSPRAGLLNSLRVVLHSPDPSMLGSPTAPVDVQTATFDVFALDELGQPVAGDFDVRLFLSFGGVKTGTVSACGDAAPDATPIEVIHLTGGQLLNHTVTLPEAFGPSALWLDEPTTHATGASPTIFFRNPFISDVQTPPDLTAANASFCSNFNGRYVTVDQAKTGGQLVVSSVFINAFVATDTSAGNYGAFNNMFVYSFGAPPGDIVPGRVLKDFSGNVSKFVGFTELNFPLFDQDDQAPLATLPPPLQLAFADLSNVPKLLGAAAGVVQYTGTECNPLPPNPNHDPTIQSTDDQWLKYNGFVVDGDGTCDSFTNFAIQLPSKVLGTFDPLQNVGKTLTVVGMLRNNSGQNPELDGSGQKIACSATAPCSKGTCMAGYCFKGSFNFWTLNPRSPADVTVQ